MCISENRITFSVITIASYICSITKAALGVNLDLRIPLNSSHPRTNGLFTSRCTYSRLRLNTTSISEEGGGSLQASNPGKKFKMLSATLVATSPFESADELNTYRLKKVVSQLHISTNTFFVDALNFFNAPLINRVQYADEGYSQVIYQTYLPLSAEKDLLDSVQCANIL